MSTFAEGPPDYVFSLCEHLLCKEREEMPFGGSFQGKWLLLQDQPGLRDGKSTGKGEV